MEGASAQGSQGSAASPQPQPTFVDSTLVSDVQSFSNLMDTIPPDGAGAMQVVRPTASLFMRVVNEVGGLINAVKITQDKTEEFAGGGYGGGDGSGI